LSRAREAEVEEEEGERFLRIPLGRAAEEWEGVRWIGAWG
jgi:hypothetical protein